MDEDKPLEEQKQVLGPETFGILSRESEFGVYTGGNEGDDDEDDDDDDDNDDDDANVIIIDDDDDEDDDDNYNPQNSPTSSRPDGFTVSNESVKFEEAIKFEALGEQWEGGEQLFDGDSLPKQLQDRCKSEVEDIDSLVGKERSEVESGSSSAEILTNVYSKLSPFAIKWTFGLKTGVEIINLTTKDAFEVFYVSAHFGVIHNYAYGTMTFLPGHNFPITSIAADLTGRWLVTADAGEDTAIIIWDKSKLLPVWSLYNVFPNEGVQYVGISQDARFLAAINTKPPFTLKFWLWTYGRDDPDAIVNIKPSFGKPKHIDFNHTNTEQFAITTEFEVIFCEWNSKTLTPKCHAPEFEIPKKKLGVLRESIFLDDNHTTLTSTSQGHVVVWCDGKYTEPIRPEIPGTIEKHYLKAVRLHKTGITSLRLCDNVIASSSEDGTILFHDQNCHLLYWFPKLKVDPLVCISFNIDDISCAKDPFSDYFAETYKEASMNEEVQNVYDYDDSEELTASDQPEERKSSKCDIPDPVDCTMDMRPFLVRDLMFATSTAKIGYVSQKRQKVKYYLYKGNSPILSMDCHPSKPHLVVGNSQGEITVYDYNRKKILVSEVFPNPVTALKYTKTGYHLMAGFQNGELLEINPLLLRDKYKLDGTKCAIKKICLSLTEIFLAFYDQASTVHVYMKAKKHVRNKWTLMGKYISHFKPIVDMLFEGDSKTHVPRLFTLGEDRMLVEYDIKNIQDQGLKILSVLRIEQTAVPRCFIWINKFFGSPHFLISNDQYKLKVLHPDSQYCMKTTLGPTADTSIKFMKVIVDEEQDRVKAKMVYATDKHIGLLLLPPTGNPFEGIGMVGNPEKLGCVVTSFDHKYVFTVGENEANPLMWEVNSKSVEVAAALGGVGVEPFVSLIEGGINGFLFNEMKDFFYYAQVIHQGESPNLARNVSKMLAVCEVPDLFRALGFYLTDYEEKNLLHELQHLNYEKNNQSKEEITFEDCVKAFINHRPIRETSITEINELLSNFADLSDPTDIIIERNELYKALEVKGEPMDHAEVLGYLCILLRPKDEQNPLPHNVTLKEITENVLGVDLSITEENVRQITHAFEFK